ncbi:hypothetical protein RRG08_024272 [Elysia crispata]|uniref:Uncharacterized protein n=1 Tax=Elysia crispata TaxID=231223 RepID=A0AAE0Z2C2_9GAST|nr:hypothetical protein RRG08_024272 [Elysia crispata]
MVGQWIIKWCANSELRESKGGDRRLAYQAVGPPTIIDRCFHVMTFLVKMTPLWTLIGGDLPIHVDELRTSSASACLIWKSGS